MTDDKKLVSLYIKVPTDDEELIRQQEIRLRKYCELKNYEVQGMYIDFKNHNKENILPDLNVYVTQDSYVNLNSYENIENPKLRELKEEIKLGKVKNVVACDIARISRNHLVVMSFLETLYSNNGNFETLDKFDMKSYIGKTNTSLFTFFDKKEFERS